MNSMFKKMHVLLFGTFVLTVVGCGDSKTTPPPPDNGKTYNLDVALETVAKSQQAYIRSLQLPSGAIKDNTESNSKICGYFANFACIALLKTPTAENISVVKKYMQWYMSKLNGSANTIRGGNEIAGSIYDYFAPNETTQGTYDSVDSYAATFLMLAAELAQIATEHKTWLAQYTDKLNLVSGALTACLDTETNAIPTDFSADDDDYLTVASFVYPAKYLMDNCEVNAGLKAAQQLQTSGLLSVATDFARLVSKNTTAIETQLWRNDMYNWQKVKGKENVLISQWQVFYADATSQLYPGLFGVISPTSERANRLYTSFNKHYPAWAAGQVYSGAYPWTLLVYAAATINDKERVEEYLKHIYTFNALNQQKNYWYTLEAAFVLLAIDKLKKSGSNTPYVPMS